jgi:hypothetical protein
MEGRVDLRLAQQILQLPPVLPVIKGDQDGCRPDVFVSVLFLPLSGGLGQDLKRGLSNQFLISSTLVAPNLEAYLLFGCIN